MNSQISLFARILYEVIAPIFLLMGAGFLLQKRLGLDIRSLTRLNFWIFVPAFLIVRVLESTLSGREVILVVAHGVISGAILWFLSWQTARIIGAGRGLQRAMTAAVVFYNSGNYGIPVAQLAFGAAGVSLQSIVMMMQNTATFTLGLGLHAGAREGARRRETLKAIWKLPMLQTLVIALAWRATGKPLPLPIDMSLHYLSNGLIPIALVTLGAQMATLKSFRFNWPLGLTLFLRLIVSPVLAYFLARALQISLPVMQSLVVAAGFPVAVNGALLAIEYDNEPQFAAAVVFYSTLFSAVTVSICIFLMRLL